MKISKFHKEYSSGRKFGLKYAWNEFLEFLLALLKFDFSEAYDEIGDISIFIQLWLYTCHKKDTELWKASIINLNKVQKRKKVWRKIYKFVGLSPEISNYCGNYKRKVKVINQLGKFEVPLVKAQEAYNEIVVPIQN